MDIVPFTEMYSQSQVINCLNLMLKLSASQKKIAITFGINFALTDRKHGQLTNNANVKRPKAIAFHASQLYKKFIFWNFVHLLITKLTYMEVIWPILLFTMFLNQ